MEPPVEQQTQEHQEADPAPEIRDLTACELAEIDEIFRALDRNHSEHIEWSEIRYMLCGLGQNPTEEQVKKMIDNAERYSETKDGRLSKEEFTELLKHEYGKMKTPEQEEWEIRQAFEVFDANKDGFIDAKELKKILCYNGSNITLPEAEAMIAEIDIDDDNKLSYIEFAKMVCKKEADSSGLPN